MSSKNPNLKSRRSRHQYRLEREIEAEEKVNDKAPIPTKNPRRTPVDKFRDKFAEFGDEDVIESG